MPRRTASAEWNGTLQEGQGTMRMASGAYEGPYSFQSRFEEGDGTNPEELIAAAHAGCFSMQFSADLARAGYDPQHVETTATVHLDKLEAGGFGITRIDLDTRGSAAGIGAAEFQEVAESSKQNCPVSRALAAVETINVRAELVN
jgi:osmotically inducible protein OsmC